MWFKRPPKVKPYAQLKGSEVKRLQALIVKQYGITAESADLWLPRNASIQHARFTISDPITGAQELDGVLYAIRLSASSSTMEPLAFQVENVVYPTIYALYKVPCVNLGMPVLQTTAHVLERMADRADLMLPGLKLNDDDEEFPLPAFRENDLIAVSVIGAGYTPMAIGTALMSSVEAKRRLGSADAAERKGKVFRTIHIINDALWNSGSRSLPPSAVAEYHQDSVSSAETHQPVDNLTQSMESLATTVEEDEIVGDAAAQICPAEMDRLFHKSLCYAIVNLMDSAEYPIPSSTLFTLYMQAGCPEDADLDIKQSSYKKLSKFVKFAAKRGVLRVKETRQGDLQVLSVNPQHEDCQLLERYRAKHKSQKQKLMTATTVDSSSGVNKQSASAERLIYTALYRLKRSDDWEELVRSTGLQIGNSESLNEREGYYTADEITRVLKAYSDSLADPSDRRWVLPDNRLAAVMGEGKTAGEVGRRYSRRQIQDAVLSNALEHFVLGPISVGEEHLPIQRGKPPLISVKEVKQGHRHMTTINNLKTFNKHAADEVVEPKQLLHELQVLCAGSTSIDDKLPKNGRQCDGLEIKVQGNHSATIARLLRDRYGVPEELIETS